MSGEPVRTTNRILQRPLNYHYYYYYYSRQRTDDGVQPI